MSEIYQEMARRVRARTLIAGVAPVRHCPEEVRMDIQTAVQTSIALQHHKPPIGLMELLVISHPVIVAKHEMPQPGVLGRYIASWVERWRVSSSSRDAHEARVVRALECAAWVISALLAVTLCWLAALTAA